MSGPVDPSEPRALPRGRHGLSADEVARSQRDRLVAAMVLAASERGYAATTVADVLRRARVSRATFYERFRDKEDCFRAAYELAASLVADVMSSALEEMRVETAGVGETPPDPLVLLDRVLSTYLELVQGAPDLARLFLIEVYGAGPAAIDQRRASLDRFVDVVAETHRGRTGILGTEPEQRFAAEIFVDAVSFRVTNLVGIGAFDELPALRAPLLRLAAQLTDGDRAR